jgi:hypothetical protein
MGRCPYRQGITGDDDAERHTAFAQGKASLEMMMRWPLTVGALALIAVAAVSLGTITAERIHLGFALSADEELAIYQQVHKSASKEALPAGFRPEVGTKVPGSITLDSLPGDLTNRLPELRKYDYVMAQNVVALVDPATRNVVDVLIQ